MVTNDTTLPPPLWPDDSPRARTGDPDTSHQAADKSQRGLSRLRAAVLDAFADGDEMTGTHLNKVYRSLHQIAPHIFPKCHPESPRKRAGELADDGLLDIVGHRKGEFGSMEAVYRISPEGRAAVEVTS